MRLTSLLFCSITICSAAMAREVPTVDYRASVKDGESLVGIECHKRNNTLEVVAINPGHSPGRRMDVWQASDLLVFDQKTSMLLKTLAVQRSCKLGDDTFSVRLEGVAGNSNAQAKCGAFATAHATVWRNGRKVYDADLAECWGEKNVASLRFVPGADAPTVTLEPPM
jgi:hypothetical protein